MQEIVDFSKCCIWGETGNRASEEEASPISSFHLVVIFCVFFTWIFRAEIGANRLDFGEFCSVLFAFSSEGGKKNVWKLFLEKE